MILLAAAKKLAFCVAFATSVAGIAHFSHPSGDPPEFVQAIEAQLSPPQQGTPHCVIVFIQAFRTAHADGVWHCFSPKLRQAFFAGDGWQGDSDFQHRYLDPRAEAGITMEVKVYKGNPTCVDLSTGAQACNAWLLYLTPITADGTRLEQSAYSLAVVIDRRGEIAQLV